MENLNQLRDEVFAINKANGWHEEKRSFGELIALVHSEVSEALEDYRNGKAVNEVWYEHKYPFNDSKVIEKDFLINNELHKSIGKPCGIPSELADVVIRILDICGANEWEIELHYERKVDITDFEEHSFTELLTEIHVKLSESYTDGRYFVKSHLGAAIQIVEFICEQNDINLEQIIREKLEYNKTRGYRHGGKVI